MRERKGIYQHRDAVGAVIADERWRIIFDDNGRLKQLDNETVRVAPFEEPRSDSLTVIFDDSQRLIELAIHGLFAKREGRVCVIGNERREATLCWRHIGEVHEKRVPWREDMALDWDTPLLKTALTRQSQLTPGQTRVCEVWRLDDVTFRPTLHTTTLRRLDDETRQTPFGMLTLAHYQLAEADWWCDSDDVVYEFHSPTRSYLLTAVNLRT